MVQDNNDNRKGDDKPKRCRNQKQDRNQKKFPGTTNKQSKAVLKLEAVKILDDVNNEGKEKLPNYSDNDLEALPYLSS